MTATRSRFLPALIAATLVLGVNFDAVARGSSGGRTSSHTYGSHSHATLPKGDATSHKSSSGLGSHSPSSSHGSSNTSRSSPGSAATSHSSSRELGGTATKHAPAANAHPSSIASAPSSKSVASHAAPYVKRDADGRIARSAAAKHEFMKQSGYPKGRPGYVVDHVIPLKKGGCDCSANMQWQTVAAAKAKDKRE